MTGRARIAHPGCPVGRVLTDPKRVLGCELCRFMLPAVQFGLWEGVEMKTPVKLDGFVLGLGAVFGAAFVVGGSVAADTRAGRPAGRASHP